MKAMLVTIAVYAATMSLPAVAQSAGPTAIAPITPIAPPRDIAYPGDIHLAVDATDLGRHIVRGRETVSGVGPQTVLLYPKWLPGDHAPAGPISRLDGL